MHLHEYADASIALNKRCSTLLDRARSLTKLEDATLPVYAVRAIMTGIVRNREGLDARNTLVDAAYGNANAYLLRSQEHALAADKVLWALEDLAQCAKHPPQRALPLLDAPERLAAIGTGAPTVVREWFDSVIVACDAYEPGDFHAILTVADAMADPRDRKMRERIRDGRDLMYLEVTRNTGSLWGKPRTEWFRRAFAQ